jgi:H+-transporting ATPase
LPPWPSWKLIIPAEATQIVGTFAAVYGWFMAAIGWSMALLVWGYALVFFLIGSAVKIAVYHTLQNRSRRQAQHLARIERRVVGG